MNKSKKSTIQVQGAAVTVLAGRSTDSISLTDIAFEFASWVSVEFRLYLIKEFQRLKEDESRRLSLAWNLNRTLSRRKRLNQIAIRQMQTLTLTTPAALRQLSQPKEGKL